MFCSECRASNADNAKFCYQCGSSILFSSPKSVVPVPTPPKNSDNFIQKLGSVFLALAGLGLLIAGVILVVGFMIFYLQNQQRQTFSSFTNSRNSQTEQGQPKREILMNKTFSVNARGYSSVSFRLNSTARIIGKVTAQGGSNDIDTIVLDADEFVNFQNTGRFRSYYRSGNMTIANINLTLNQGEYYIVFSNISALLTNKVVTANIEQIEIE